MIYRGEVMKYKDVGFIFLGSGLSFLLFIPELLENHLPFYFLKIVGGIIFVFGLIMVGVNRNEN